MTNKTRILLAILSGVLLFLGYPPISLGFLAPVALAVLLGLMVTGTGKQAFWTGLLSGAVCYTCLVYWIPRLMQTGLIVALALGMVLFIAFLSFWTALSALLVNRAAKRNRNLAVLLFPVIWVGQEKFRELGEMSFPWFTTGYTYSDYTALLQGLSFTGVFGYSLLIAASASLLFLAFTLRKNMTRAALCLLIVLLLHAGLFVYGKIRMGRPLQGKSLTVSLIQSNVDSYAKWDRAFTDSIVNRQMDMTRTAAAKGGVDITVWAESSIPCYFLHEPAVRYRIQRLSDSLALPLLFGSIDYTRNMETARGYDFFCSAFYCCPGKRPEKYDKVKLVPFGERLPFQGIFPLISRVDLGGGDFTPGRNLRLFELKGVRFFAPICYEVVYPDHIRAFAKCGGEVMIEITNDGWYGRSGMPYQHMALIRYRAVENGIPAAQCANTGISAFVDPLGRQSPAPDIYTADIVTRRMAVATLPTFYRSHGDIIGWCCLVISLLYLLSVPLSVLIQRKR